MHIAILDADIPVPNVYASRGLYSTQFRTLLQAAASRLTTTTTHAVPEINTSSYDVVGGVLPALNRLRTAPLAQENGTKNESEDVIDGILITGSSNSACDKHTKPWIAELEKYIQTVFVEFPGVKIFGSCFGHQIIAQALLSPSLPENDGAGFHVEQCPYGYEVGIVPITLDSAFNEAFPHIAKNLKNREFRLQLVHGDRVFPIPTNTPTPDPKPEQITLPSPWLNLGYTSKCPIQGLYHPGRVLTFQGHFEFDSFVNRETCIEFGRRFGWKEDDIGGSVKGIDVAVAEEGGDGDDDDSRVAAEGVVLFFAGLS
ncbi:hypothetical protein SI65_08615 [Aspergillus cristatus]|uniref:Glutamine amidotransferase domain-containing protein n=1 Tax=Aspergillus cristatus TaxID=573508 RepID=A0A1E3B481_ASPCR|nr:hypothetical protein SI65_08615 [Aspergillus cristatus]